MLPNGSRVKLEHYESRKAGEYYRWQCVRSTHGSACVKKRSTALTATYGDVESLAFLCCWYAHPESHADTRREFKPDEFELAYWATQLDPDVAAFLALLRSKDPSA